MPNVRLIAVIGANECDASVCQQAYDVGAGIARAGFAVICGGRGGVMEAACKGASDNEGLTIGILPGDDATTANQFVDVAIPTGMGIARNVIIVRSALCVIAINGGPGTLSEIAHSIQLNVPVVSLGSFDVSPEITQAKSADEAVQIATRLASAQQ